MGPLIAGIALVVVAAIALVAALVSSRDDADNSFGANPVGSPVMPCPYLRHAVIQIEKLVFAGNHIVECDTYGGFPQPEWWNSRATITLGGKDILTALGQSPVCYTRGQPVRFTPTFRVTTAPTQTEVVQIRAVAMWGSVVMNWTGSVTVSPSSTEVTASQSTSDVALPNHVDCVDAFETSWGMNPAGQGWNSAGTTRNTLYVVLGDPANGKPAYWTLLDVSCRAAALHTTDNGVIVAVYGPLRDREITRKRDGVGLTYWGTAPHYDQTGAMSTPMLLRAENASGQCGSWANVLLDMYQVHGITRGRKIALARSAQYWRGNGNVGFLVKFWRFDTPPASSPNDWTHKLYQQCVLVQKAPGQRNPNPPEWFWNHYIVWIDNVYYDPSYGSGPFSSQGAWENASMDGLIDTRARPMMAGFDKSLPPNRTTNLMDFVTIPE